MRRRYRRRPPGQAIETARDRHVPGGTLEYNGSPWDVLVTTALPGRSGRVLPGRSGGRWTGRTTRRQQLKSRAIGSLAETPTSAHSHHGEGYDTLLGPL